MASSTVPPELCPHAEEVVLPKGVKPVPVSSTTGRRRSAVPSSKTARGKKGGNETRGGSTNTTSDNRVSGSRRNPSPAATSSTSSSGDCHYDNFGFQVTLEEKAAEDALLHKMASSDADAGRRWRVILDAEWQSTDHMKKKKLCRQGVPQPLRAAVWERFLLVDHPSPRSRYKERGDTTYERLCNAPLEPEMADAEIYRDLDRTFPTHRLFQEGIQQNGVGQLALQRILRAYGHYNPTVGYCQGLGFLAATLWIQLRSEEKAFWALTSVMENPLYNMQRLHQPGFPQLHCCFYVLQHLTARVLPKVAARMEELGISFAFFSTQWLMTLFSYDLNFRLVSHIWDMFVCEGWKPIYRVALALLKMEEAALLRMRDETEMLLHLKKAQESKDPAVLIDTALNIKFKTAKVARLTKEYWAAQNAK